MFFNKGRDGAGFRSFRSYHRKSTTHSTHHGKHKEDGITYYKGNFGNMLFIWDMIFGTAKITGKVPEEFGMENLEPAREGQQLLWPLFRG